MDFFLPRVKLGETIKTQSKTFQQYLPSIEILVYLISHLPKTTTQN